MKSLVLSLYFGNHDSCITFASDKEVLLHLEAERVFRKKHHGVSADEMEELISVGLSFLGSSIEEVSRVYLACFMNQFASMEISILGRTFNAIPTGHHTNHIGTVFPAAFDDAVVVVADGGSEDGSTKLYTLEEKAARFVEDLDDTIMTGKFYGTLTQLVINPEFMKAHSTYPGKTMGLAGWGKMNFSYLEQLQKLRGEMNRHHSQGISSLLREFNLENDYTSPWLDEGRCDLAHTGQAYWLANFYEKLSSMRARSSRIALAGGCALNVSLNSSLVDTGLYSEIYVSPVASDCGQSLGAILFNEPNIKCEYPFLGRGFGECKSLPPEVLEDLLSGRIIAWYEGRSEIGPRALGHRSFLGIPSSFEMRDRMNRIKGREPYRPVSAVVPVEFLKFYFHTPHLSPYMTLAPKATEETRKVAPAIVHADGTTRIQTVRREDPSQLHAMCVALYEAGVPPILMNSSFNGNGTPIVDTIEDAKQAFKSCEADALYVNGECLARR